MEKELETTVMGLYRVYGSGFTVLLPCNYSYQCHFSKVLTGMTNYSYDYLAV